MRTLRSKHKRNSLYIANNGKCSICNKKLNDDWEVDHIIPYWICKKTEMENLQAVCKKCNLKKGDKMLRKHQNELINILNDEVNEYKATGTIRKSPLVLDVFPGGGKSTHPIIAAKILKDAGIIDKICWVVPRVSLKNQGAEEFLKTYLQEDFPHNLEIRETETTNDTNPTRGSDGYVTTYQSLSTARANNKNTDNIHQYEFKQAKYLLYLDECQHISIDKKDIQGYSYYQAVKPLVDNAAYVICASGTLFRHEKEKIAFIPYEKQFIDGKTTFEPIKNVTYDYNDAINDKAIIPLFVEYGPPKLIKYTKVNGKESETIERTEFVTNTDLSVALESGYGEELLDWGIKQWDNYKHTINKRSKLIIIGHDQKSCKDYFNKLNKQFKICLAISDEGKQAQEAIKKFRTNSEYNILITCQMAYEGLDCKQATHVIALTKIRSIPWLIQMLTRVMRYDKDNNLSWEDQYATAIVPNDERMKEALKYINAKEPPLLEEEDDDDFDFLNEIETINDGEKNSDFHIDNKESYLDEIYHSDLEGNNLPLELSKKINIWKNKPENKIMKAQPDIEIYKFMRDNNTLSILDSIHTTIETVVLETKIKTIREREKEARNKIEKITRKLDYKFGDANGTWNKKTFNKFRYTKRKDMTLKELEEVLQWIKIEAQNEAVKKKLIDNVFK